VDSGEALLESEQSRFAFLLADLTLCSAFADVADECETEHSSACRAFVNAEEGHRAVTALLSLALTVGHRVEIIYQLEKIGRRLDGLRSRFALAKASQLGLSS
jgi:hypothetical protein